MGQKKHAVEEIVAKLRQVDVESANQFIKYYSVIFLLRYVCLFMHIQGNSVGVECDLRLVPS